MIRDITELRTENTCLKIKLAKKKKGLKILTKAMRSLSKTIKKAKEQEEFLNTLLDERDEELTDLRRKAK